MDMHTQKFSMTSHLAYLVCCGIFLTFSAGAGHAAMLADFNDDQAVNLSDCILCLQAASGTGSETIELHLDADVNNDGKIGMEDALYCMQMRSGLRSHPDIDDDHDGYSENNGDCDDSSGTVYPGALEICGDGIDQDCNGSDLECVPKNIYFEENFSTDSGGFLDYWSYQAQGGVLRFNGDGTEYSELTFWNGGPNPSNSWDFQPVNSNYFTDANISVDATWVAGSNNYFYGLSIYLDNNAQGEDNGIGFGITRDGYYLIYKIENDEDEILVSWTPTFLLDVTGQANRLEVERKGDNYRFFINGVETEELTINGFDGGGVGLETTHMVDVAYDNFKVTSPYRGQLEIPSEGYRIARNQLIYQCMTSTYLWSDKVQSIDYQGFESAEDLLKALRYDELDRFSYIVPKEEHEQLFEEGKYTGIGIGIDLDDSSTCRIKFVYPQSPAALAGLRRGDRILKINNQTIEAINNKDIWEGIFGPDEVGTPVTLLIDRDDESRFSVDMEKSMVDIKTVLYTDVLSAGSKKVGYLVFNEFLNTALEDLDETFNYFKGQGVEELIIDLRYNPGGNAVIAQYIADRIVNQAYLGQTWLKYSHNDRYSIWDAEWPLLPLNDTLSLERLFVITTQETCSASEALINGLKPFMDVVAIGDTTCGKPVGMYGYDIFDMHISPIEFSLHNADDIGDYFDGLNPTCTADDDLDHSLGDSGEGMLQEALNFINNGICSKGSSKGAAAKAFSKKPGKSIMTGFRRQIGAY